MGDCHVEERNSPPVESPEQMAGRLQAGLMTALPAWKAGLGADRRAYAPIGTGHPMP